MSEPDRHKEFESISDCHVYKYEVESDWHLFGTVEYIDTTKASGCVKNQLSNAYLLHLDDTVIVVYGEHPKKRIDLIKKHYNDNKSDTTKLTEFTKLENGYNITVSRLCKDTGHFRNNQFVDWKLIKYRDENGVKIKTDEELLDFWYDWNKK